jgi:hypothetical protein
MQRLSGRRAKLARDDGVPGIDLSVGRVDLNRNGDRTVAIHWDYAREALQKADGVIATVGLEADRSAISTEPRADKDK